MSLKILLDDQINQLFAENPELKSLDKNDFEIAVANIVNLKYLEGLDFDELTQGILGNGGDEGIDLCYLFHNGSLVVEDDIQLNKRSNLILKLFQVKKETGYSTDGFRKLCEGIEEIFDLELDLSKLSEIGANQDFIDKTNVIRTIFRESRLKKSKFSIEVYYVTIAANATDISEKIKHLEQETKNKLNYISIDFEYWGVQQLLNLAEGSDETIELEFEGQPLSISDKFSSTTGFAGFISGEKLIEALVDSDGRFRDELTDGNIRFFLGEDKKVNSDIIETAVSDQKSSNFWAMNNGLTIIGEALDPSSSKGLIVTNPQIVNGCQTVHCLYSAYSSKNQSLPEGLRVFTKLVKTPDDKVQADIISATNSQNRVKSSSLKANEYIQRNIEKHLLKYGIFYERRENFYKRKNKTGLKVVSLEKLTQITHTVINKRAVEAVNDTSKIFEEKYEHIFVEDTDYDIYNFACQLYLKVWSLKNSDIRNNPYSSEEKELISKGGFCLLHILTSLMMSEAKYKKGDKEFSEIHIGNIVLNQPLRKNEFSKRKEDLFCFLDQEELIHSYYERGKSILFNAAQNYRDQSKKSITSLFKIRSFDNDYLKVEIENHLTNEE